MTLPSSGQLTIAQILAEIGDSFPVTIPNANWRTLAGKPSGSLVIPNDFWGKTWGGAPAPSSATEISTYADTATASGVASVAGVSFGAAAATRRVFLLVHWSCNTSAVETLISSATIGGVAATLHVQTGEGGTSAFSNYGCAIISATVPTGATGTVNITFNNATSRACYFTVYRVIGLVSATPTDTGSAFDESPELGGTYSASVAGLSFPASSLAFFAATGSTSGTFGNMSTTVITETQEQNMTQEGRLSNGMRRSVTGSQTVTTSGTVSAHQGRLRLVCATFQLA